MVAHRRALVSERDFLALPETNQSMELVDGEVVMAPGPSYWHQEIIARLVEQIRTWARQQDPTPSVAFAPLSVRIAPARIVQPDIVLFSPPLDRDEANPIERIPTLCVEVLSSDRVYDRVTKRYLYAQAGVSEYWIVDLNGAIERYGGPGLEQVELLDTELSSPLFPGLRVDIRALLS